MVQYTLEYLGYTEVDKLFSNPMFPWILADLRKRKCNFKVLAEFAQGCFKVSTVNGILLFQHDLSQVIKFCHENNNMRTFMYLLKTGKDDVAVQCHVFTAFEFEEVVEIFQTMKDALHPQRSQSSAASLTSLCNDISPSNSQFFEVLYVGKIKVSHRRVPDTFVDDALEKIRQHELEKKRRLESEENDKELIKSRSLEMGRRVSDNCMIVPANEQPEKNSTEQQENSGVKDVENAAFRRNRTGSLGIIETIKKKTDDANNNRTMLFYVGRNDLRLISPDRKQILLNKTLKDVTGCMRGIKNCEHFCFICNDSDAQSAAGYVAYVFRCESDSIAEDVVATITQCFQYLKDHKTTIRQPVLSCEHCPMVWYHKLCSDLEGQSEKKCQTIILKRIENLPEEEQDIIHTKLLGAESSEIKEQVDFLMILLRAHCEAKQAKHIHDTAENRSEFLNQYLGGSTIFMKAKRSLTSSFDQLLKRKGSQLDMNFGSKESLARKLGNEGGSESDSQLARRRSSTVGTMDVETMKKELKKAAVLLQGDQDCDNTDEKNPSTNDGTHKKPSLSDIANITVNNQKLEKTIKQTTPERELPNEAESTPMINIFLKVGSSSPRTNGEAGMASQTTPSPSWRQAIYNRVVTPGKNMEEPGFARKKTREDLRNLWKKAIYQQVLLIRMERENARLRARQEEATVKRIKLEYDELSFLSKDYMGIWDLISKDSRISTSKCDPQMLLQAIRQGVPKSKRGDVWHFLATQFCMKQPPFDSSKFPSYDVPYEDLLKQLTSSQHAILIDLGRTFPNHPYFASPLGPGQLALFNLLKAYSLLDPQVGYCQGLSFVAGVLLLHMSEEQAFLLLRHLMFRRNMRRQYLPDMGGLQVQLYQLSRLLHDVTPKLYQHFDHNEIAPTLYAASWMLTLFASQFPLGFVTRVFDLLFLEHKTDIIFRVILALLEEHRERLLSLQSFEDIMEYLKTLLPQMDCHILEKVMKRALTMDISKQLREYEVEYHVLQEERLSMKPEQEQLKRAELEVQRLTDQNLALIEQLDVVNATVNRLERARNNQQAQINRLENQIRNLEITIATLGDFIVDIGEEHKDIEIPGDIRRLIANLELAEQRSTKKIRNDLVPKNKFDKSALLKRSQTSMGFYERPAASEELFSAEELPRGTRYGQSPKREVSEEITRPIKGVPLRVIVDEDDTRKSPPSPSNFSKISSFFNAKQKKPYVVEGHPGHANDSFSDDDDLKKFTSDIGQLNLKTSVVNNSIQNRNGKKLLKTQSEMILPNFTNVNGTKSLKPIAVRPINLKPVNQQEILQVNEELIDFTDGKKLIDSKEFQAVTEKF